MPSRDYGDLSRLALQAELDIDELRALLRHAAPESPGRVAGHGTESSPLHSKS
jgi:hypothetical protein